MDKQDLKKILMSMRTPENETIANNLLGIIDMLDKETFTKTIQEIGTTEENIRTYFEKKLSRPHDDTFPINDMFTYGISGNCIHLHLPCDLRQMMSEQGISKAINFVNLNLLDALDKLSHLKNDGFYKFQDVDSIFMISPILVQREMKFLESIGFQTTSYKKKELNDDKFLEEHQEAQLATHIFGRSRNVGTASIPLEKVSSKAWQDRKKQILNSLAEKGIVIDNKSFEEEK